jgi:replicative superfamily II helicase
MMLKNINGLDFVATLFDDIGNLTPNTLKLEYLHLLDILTTQPNDIIQSICSVPLVTTTIFSKSRLGTYDANIFMGPTIIATNDVVEYTLIYFKDLLDEINSHTFRVDTVGSEEGVTEPYYYKYETFSNMLKITDKIAKASARSSSCASNIVTNPKSVYFSNKYQINTQSHYEYFTQEKAKNLNLNFRLPINLETIDFSLTRVSDDILTLLCAGIGLYSLNNNRLDKPYLNIMFELATRGQLAYIISDKSIIYGINIPVNYVLVDNEFSQSCNVFELVQLFGRAGRLGKSNFAKCYVESTGMSKLYNLIKGIDDGEEEVRKIIAIFDAEK